jgi:superfamily I DNA/RNA helicase
MPTFRTGVPPLDIGPWAQPNDEAEGLDFSANGCHTSRMEFNASLANPFAPTAEQEAIIAASTTGENVVVTAVAGSGKTSTLRLIAAANPTKRFLYLAFGKDIQLEAERTMPSNVESRTAHSIAYAYCAQNHPALMRKMKNDPKPWDTPKIVGLPYQQAFEDQGETRVMSDKNLMAHVNATVTRFCHSKDEAITERHVPREFGDNVEQGIFARFIARFAAAAWGDLMSETGSLRFGHDHYLKVWSLDCPVLNADVVLFDEAQDADPAISHVVENQPTQVIMVGDASQAIYGWRGAVDALSKFQAPHRLTLTQSFRFGAAIAAFANGFLNALNAEVRVVGNEAKDSTVTPLGEADAILCRTNAGVIEYAIMMLDAGKRVAIAGGTKELTSFVRAAQKLMDIERTGKGFCAHAELGAFKTWTDAVEHAGTEDGSDIRIKVKLVQEYGAARLLDILASLVDVKTAKPGDYDVVISTAHKAKGLEWDSVKIGADFKLPTEAGELPSDADLMLMYVAVTRAKLSLDPGILAGLAL